MSFHVRNHLDAKGSYHPNQPSTVFGLTQSLVQTSEIPTLFSMFLSLDGLQNVLHQPIRIPEAPDF